MKKLLLLLLGLSVCFGAESCKAKKKKKDNPVTPPTIVGSPTPPPQEPPKTPDNPTPAPDKPNPVPVPDPVKPAPDKPAPVPEPDKPVDNPVPVPSPLPLDPFNRPIIPTTPVIVQQHVILNDGVVVVERGEVSVHSCADRAVYAYYIPCKTSLRCWDWFAKPTTCGYFICQRW